MRRVAKRKKLRQQHSSRLSKSGPWGFDYGVSIRTGAIGSIDFTQKLREAEVIAVAYGSMYSEEVQNMVPVLTLVGRHEVPLQETFKEFNRWAEASDGDAVDLTLVFGKRNGYTLIIGADPERLVNRILKYDVIGEPFSFLVWWVKRIDSLSSPLKNIRMFLERGIRPFILSAATYSGLTAPDAQLPELLKPVRDLRNLLKFNIRFVDEGSERDEEWQRIARLAKDKKARSKLPRRESRLPDPKSVFSSRSSRLKALFPVTLWRAETSEDIKRIIAGAEMLGLRHWQSQQGLCNVLLSREVGKGEPHFMGIPEADWPERLVSRLRERYEIANGDLGLVASISPEEIVRQAVLDAGALLSGYGEKVVSSNLNLVQKALKKHGLL